MSRGAGSACLIPSSYCCVGDVALFVHFFKHQVAAPEGVFGVDLGIEGRGRGDDRASVAASQGSSTEAQGSAWRAAARMGLAEVGAGRRLDPVGALAEVDRVQVLGEDFVLGPVVLER